MPRKKPLPLLPKHARKKSHILVLDVGTTGIKALVFDREHAVVARAYRPIKKTSPRRGWVEQDPQELLDAAKAVLREAVRKSGLPHSKFLGAGITNQRETVIAWDKATGRPIYPAIVWEDTRTTVFCKKLEKKFGRTVRAKTGLSINPYFSASKLHWMFRHVPEAKKSLSAHRLLCGTVDTWIAWNFLEGRPHVTDCTNASRTLLFNVRTLTWDRTLLDIFDIPEDIMPRVRPSRSDFGILKSSVLGFSLPVRAMCGDQQASLHATGLAKGAVKVTYGTGTFISQVLSSRFILREPFFTMLAACTPKPVYALEAKIDKSGAQVQLALGNTTDLHNVLKKLSAEVAKLLKKLPTKPKSILIDGGIAQSPDLAALQSEAASVIVHRQKIHDGTALGVALLAAG